MSLANHYQFAAVLTSVVNIILLLIVAKKGVEKKLVSKFALYCSAIIFWSFFVTLTTTVWDYSLAMLFSQLCHVGAALIPTFFLHFVRAFLRLKRKPLGVWCFDGLTAFFVMVIIFAPNAFFQGVSNKLGFPYFPNAGPLYTPWMLLFFTIVAYGHVELYRAISSSKGLKRKQLWFFFIANSLGYLGGIGCFLPVYNLDVFPFPYGPYGVVIFSIVTVYTILRYKFLEIEIIIKRTLVFAGLFAMVMGVIGLVTTLTQVFLGRYVAVAPWVATALTVLLTIVLYDPTRKLLVNLTDRYLFQKKENVKVILNRLSQNIITILDIEKVGRTILSTLENSMRVETGAIVLKEENEKSYRVLDCFGIGNNKVVTFDRDDFFIRYLVDTNRVINLEHGEEREKLPTFIAGKLQDFKASLCIPLFLHMDLIGILLLGKKKSDEEYTQEELDYLPTVASQVAIALSNARLYDILKKSQIDFAQQAKMAAIGTLSAGISHEVKNPLNHMRLAVGMLRLNRKLGVYTNLSREAFEKEVFEALEKVDENITRATEVIERLSSFAKKPKELRIEPIRLEQAMEQAFKLLDRELEHYGIEVKREYDANLPLVYADLHAMEDILLNLLVNARHAIGEKGRITVSTRRVANEVEIAIGDSGSGIAKENLEKIFDPFFTTKDTSRNSEHETVKGTGLGLFIVRELIKKFDGRILVESEVGKGSTFRILFPVPEEALAHGA